MNFNAEKLRTERRKRNMSQEGLAYALIAQGTKASRQTVNNWEKGKHTPRLEALIGLAKIFGRRVNYFLN